MRYAGNRHRHPHSGHNQTAFLGGGDNPVEPLLANGGTHGGSLLNGGNLRGEINDGHLRGQNCTWLREETVDK